MLIAFQSAAGISINNFMALVEFHLCATHISFENKLYKQKKGICIGSFLAPELGNIFLAGSDRDLSEYLNGDEVFYV